MNISFQQWRLVLAICIALVSVLQTGILTGWTSPVLSILQSTNSTIPVTSDEGSWIATTLPLVSLFCTPIAVVCLHYLGRKPTILFSIFPFIIFWIMCSVASSVTELIVARGIAGLGMALAYTVTPVYLGEISPDDMRGGIGIGMNVVINIGTLWIYWIGTYPELWISSAASIIPTALIFIFYAWLPESPYYLMEHGKKEEARMSLEKLTQNKDNIEEELDKIESTIVVDNKADNALKLVLFEPQYRRALLISIGSFTFAQLTGGVTFVFYAHLIFQKAGNVSANTMSMIKATLQLITSIGAAYVVDSIGRKPLLIISCVGSALFMSCEGLYFYLLDNQYNVKQIWWLPLAAMILFNISQVIGLQSIPLMYLGELFHPRVKSVAVCISKAYLALCVFIVGKLYQIMADNLGNSVPFFVFSAIGVIGVFFVIFCVPETKGRTLEDIQYYMKHKKYKEVDKL